MDVQSTKKALREHLAEGLTRIVIDATRDDVVVPLEHKRNPTLVLNLSYKFKGHALSFEWEALHITLTFAGASFRCVLPYAAVLLVAPFVAKVEPERRMNHLKVVK